MDALLTMRTLQVICAARRHQTVGTDRWLGCDADL